MLVAMTVFALLLWYHVEWLQQRRALVEARLAFPLGPNTQGEASRRAPGLLSLFGEQGYAHVSVMADEDDELVDQVRRAYPEATCTALLDEFVQFGWQAPQ